MLMLTVY